MNSSPEEVLFQLALAKPAEKRAAFLDVMCDGDPALRQRLEALLAADELNGVASKFFTYDDRMTRSWVPGFVFCDRRARNSLAAG